MAPKPQVTRAEIVELMIRERLKPAEVARKLGVSRQVVSYHLKHGSTEGWESPAAVAASKLPWKDVPQEVVRDVDAYHSCRDHVRYMDTDGEGMSATQLRRLRRWYELLTAMDEVVEYSPEIKPNRSSKHGYFHYVPRTARDGDLILRTNKYTRLSKADKELWRLPDREDWPAAG